MRQLTCDIRIGNMQLFNVNSVTVERSWKNITGTATITLPRKFFTASQNEDDVRKLLVKGMPVEIRLGYDLDEVTEFKGYISGLLPGIPVTIQCEDEMWKLKQSSFTKTWRSVTLKELIKFIAPNVDVNLSGDINLGRLELTRASAAVVLEKLRDMYGLVAYFKGQTLYVGFAYAENPTKMTIDLLDLAIDDNLRWVGATDTRIQLKAISIQPTNHKVEVTVGDDGGEIRTLHVGYGLTQKEVLKIANEKLKLFKFDGWHGSFVTFGAPSIDHGYILEFVHPRYPDRNGEYFVDGIKITFGQGGYRRTVEMGRRAS